MCNFLSRNPLGSGTFFVQRNRDKNKRKCETPAGVLHLRFDSTKRHPPSLNCKNRCSFNKGCLFYCRKAGTFENHRVDYQRLKLRKSAVNRQFWFSGEKHPVHRRRKVRMRKRKVPRKTGAMTYVYLPCLGCGIFLSRPIAGRHKMLAYFYCLMAL